MRYTRARSATNDDNLHNHIIDEFDNTTTNDNTNTSSHNNKTTTTNNNNDIHNDNNNDNDNSHNDNDHIHKIHKHTNNNTNGLCRGHNSHPCTLGNYDNVQYHLQIQAPYSEM